MEHWWKFDGNCMEIGWKMDGDWLKIDSERTLEDQDSSTARSEKLANSQDSTCVQADPGVSFGFLCKRHFQLGKLVTGGPRILSYFRADVWIYIAYMTPTFIQFQLQPISDSETAQLQILASFSGLFH
jgi:hypothetical protein